MSKWIHIKTRALKEYLDFYTTFQKNATVSRKSAGSSNSHNEAAQGGGARRALQAASDAMSDGAGSPSLRLSLI